MALLYLAKGNKINTFFIKYNYAAVINILILGKSVSESLVNMVGAIPYDGAL